MKLTKHIANSSNALFSDRKITADSQFIDISTDKIRPLLQPFPGEIWEISGAHVVDGKSRYLMIVHEPVTPELTVCAGMLFAVETEYLSAVDVLIPIAITGLERDVLAETWNVGQVSIDQLVRPIGNRLSRQVYDLLLSIGNGDPEASGQAQQLGLIVAANTNAEFHCGEQRLLASVSPTTMSWTNSIVAQAIEAERELIDVMHPPINI